MGYIRNVCSMHIAVHLKQTPAANIFHSITVTKTGKKIWIVAQEIDSLSGMSSFGFSTQPKQTKKPATYTQTSSAHICDVCVCIYINIKFGSGEMIQWAKYLAV